jgi:hypothetical protein
MTKTISFETEVENGYIKVPVSYDIHEVKVILMWNDEAKTRTKDRTPKLPCLAVDMTGYKFDRDDSLETAADRLYADYKDDKELTAFTQLDCEDFYEPRWNLAC